MRILYIHPELANFHNAVGETARQLVRELRNAGADVVTFPSSVSETGDKTFVRIGPNRIRQFATRRLPNSIAMFLLEMLLVSRGAIRSIFWSFTILNQRKRLSPDIVMARAFEYDWSPWIAARILQRPLILETHSPNYVERELRGQRRSRFTRWVDHTLWARADRLWVVSKNLADIVASSGIDPVRIRHISLGVTTAQFDTDRNYGENRRIKIAFVGSFHPWHGVDTLLEAFALVRSRNVEGNLLLIGDGVTRTRNQHQADTLGVSQHVEFTGWLPITEIVERLISADIAVAPYARVERFHFDPVKILEYMAMGLPVIASNQGEVPSILDEGRCGVLVPPGESGPLADEIARLARDAELRRTLGSAAKMRVQTHYDWSLVIQQVLALCNETVSPP